MDEAEQVAPGSLTAWHDWLREHHADVRGVWLEMTARVAEGDDALSYENAVCEALCWGWIDGQVRGAADGRGAAIWMSPRRRGSAWAASNRARVARLVEEGRMRQPGQAVVDAARADGSWTVLVGPEQGEEPDALRAGLDADPAARAFWDALPPSARLFALTQLATAKREPTRLSRIEKLLAQCRAGERPDR
jgi:uncharacterized protein YdeI (YjbR/CyaY-like superfamily)